MCDSTLFDIPRAILPKTSRDSSNSLPPSPSSQKLEKSIPTPGLEPKPDLGVWPMTTYQLCAPPIYLFVQIGYELVVRS